MTDPAARTKEIASTMNQVGAAAHLLMEEMQKFMETGVGEVLGIRRTKAMDFDVQTAEGAFLSRLDAALNLPTLCRKAGVRWPVDSDGTSRKHGSSRKPTETWACVLAWCALECMGELVEPGEPDPAAVQLFDSLRLRNAIAESLERCGIEGEERWRAAARIRASFAHAGKLSAPYSWVHDPDVAWVIGVHEHDGEKYLVKEQFEKLLWWMAFRHLLDMAAESQPEIEKLAELEQEIRTRLETIAEGGYRVEALEDGLTRENSEARYARRCCDWISSVRVPMIKRAGSIRTYKCIVNASGADRGAHREDAARETFG